MIFRCCCLPTDCSRDYWEGISRQVRHDAHLSASSHLFGMPGLWKARGQKEASPKLQSKGSVYIPIQYMKETATCHWQVCQAWWCDMIYSQFVALVHRQKQEKRRVASEKILRSPKTTSSEDSTGYESLHVQRSPQMMHNVLTNCNTLVWHKVHRRMKLTAKVVLAVVTALQSEIIIGPQGEADGQSFVFPAIAETSTSSSSGGGNSNTNSVGTALTAASPSPNALPPPPGSPLMSISGNGPNIINCGVISSCNATPATTPTQGSPNLSLIVCSTYETLCGTRKSPTSPDQTSIEDATEFHDNGLAMNLRLCSASSSTTSSLTSVAAVSLGGGVIAHQASSSSSAAAAAALAAADGAGAQQRVSDPWLQPQSDRERDSHHERRRSSTMTARYSLFDALDLEYALLRVAARGSVGPYSLSESIHKLTFTQSLAFPALARGLASKRRRSNTRTSSRPLNPNESGLNTCAKQALEITPIDSDFDPSKQPQSGEEYLRHMLYERKKCPAVVVKRPKNFELSSKTESSQLELEVRWMPYELLIKRVNLSTSAAPSPVPILDLASSDRWLGDWFYAVLACLHLPLEPNVHSTLRDIARTCMQYRSLLKSHEFEKAIPYNLFIYLIGYNSASAGSNVPYFINDTILNVYNNSDDMEDGWKGLTIMLSY
ncbi:Protein Gemin2 [Eumeta japonica]|uniref:Protein Gemin2 n=1 Tax=Eumeta variegata TaxID=151549 RepID=A0A4C2AAI9_EUMVA|nr:Protein Gemin2 [Eumeta japonica]